MKLKELRKHNFSIAKGGESFMQPDEIKTTIKESLPQFAKEVHQLRTGRAKSASGKPVKARDVSFEKAVKTHYGTDIPTFLNQLGIYTHSMTLEDMGQELGVEMLSGKGVEDLLISNSQSFETITGTPANTGNVDPDHRFIIPELIISAIRTGYEHTSMSGNWVSTTVSINKRELKMPQIRRGDGMPTKISEGADMPFGSLSFGQKQAEVFKIGTGFKITDELVFESTLDMLFLFLQEVGNDMAIANDVVALNTLINGEQADLSESAPVVGVDNVSNGFTYLDMKRVFTRMERLGQPATRIISGEDDTIDITGLPRFEGFDGATTLSDIRTIVGVPDRFEMDVHVPPADQIIFVSPQKAMVKLQYRSMMTERRRNPKNQTDELFVSDHVGFAIVKRDARVILDKSVTIVASPFPDYMDIDARIAESHYEF